MGTEVRLEKHVNKFYFIMFVNIWTICWYLHTLDDISSVIWQLLLPNIFTTLKNVHFVFFFPSANQIDDHICHTYSCVKHSDLTPTCNCELIFCLVCQQPNDDHIGWNMQMTWTKYKLNWILYRLLLWLAEFLIYTYTYYVLQKCKRTALTHFY
jgi:hypothetical protein